MITACVRIIVRHDLGIPAIIEAHVDALSPNFSDSVVVICECSLGVIVDLHWCVCM